MLIRLASCSLRVIAFLESEQPTAEELVNSRRMPAKIGKPFVPVGDTKDTFSNSNPPIRKALRFDLP
jgi:hypothetical protein